MQEALTYSPEELERIKQYLSQERLESCLTIAANDSRAAIRPYERNTSLSEALYWPVRTGTIRSHGR